MSTDIVTSTEPERRRTDLDGKVDRMRVDMITFGGHRIATCLHPRDPRFQQLLQAYGDTAERSAEAFGLPTLDGAGTLFIRPRDILEIRVDRILQPTVPVNTGAAQTSLVVRDFLALDTRASLLNDILGLEKKFTPSTINDRNSGKNVVNSERRISTVLYEADIPNVKTLFVEKIRDRLPEVCARLAIAPFEPARFECQATAHHDGAFFRRHTDSAAGRNVGRILSFVYYLWREPRLFSGGNLKFYGPDGKASKQVEPDDNSIVFFPSVLEHEVTPVTCLSKSFADGRFTVNGWVHGKKDGPATSGELPQSSTARCETSEA
jgi:hypothetical protein